MHTASHPLMQSLIRSFITIKARRADDMVDLEGKECFSRAENTKAYIYIYNFIWEKVEEA